MWLPALLVIWKLFLYIGLKESDSSEMKAADELFLKNFPWMFSTKQCFETFIFFSFR